MASQCGPAPLLGTAPLQRYPLIGHWVAFAVAGVAIRTGKVEFGQGVHAALATIASAELQVALDRVSVEPVCTRYSPDEDYTAGSLSLTQSGAAIRAACAAARSTLLGAVADSTGVPSDSLRIEDGHIKVGGLVFSYWTDLPADTGERLIDSVAVITVPSASSPDGLRHDLGSLLRGRRGYIHDLELPAMLHGRVVRPPPPRRRLLHMDDTRARKLADVVVVVRNGDFLGVVAEREEAAVEAAERLGADCRWSDSALPDLDERGDWLASSAGEAELVHSAGKLQWSASWTEATYSKPHIAHGSIGPSAAVARFLEDGSLEVWSHTQGVYPLKRELAATLNLPPEMVHITHVQGSGCYGHNGAEDAALDAALLALAVRGRPVKLVWSRADECGHEPYGPAMRMRVAASLDEEGRVAAWQHEFWSNGHVGRPGFTSGRVLLAAAEMDPPSDLSAAIDPPMPPGGSQRNSVPLYSFPSVRIVRHPVPYEPLRVSSLRALGAFGNVFAIESFMDELAAAAGVDPLEFRLRHLEDPRARDVIQAAATHAGWGTPHGEGRGLGMAFARYKNSAAYCAVVAEVSEDAALGVDRLVVCVDAGRVVTMDGLRNQLEGGAIQAASWTLKEAVRPRSGSLPLDWEQYPILRFTEVPNVETIVIDRPEALSLGAGECVAGPVAAAIANAFAAAYGVRIRHLPITRERVLAELQE